MKAKSALDEIGPRTWTDKELSQAFQQHESDLNSLINFCIELPTAHYSQVQNPNPERLLAAIAILGITESESGPNLKKELRRRKIPTPRQDPHRNKLAGLFVDWARKATEHIEPAADQKFLASCGIAGTS